jgi:Zn-dependent metalloprotease
MSIKTMALLMHIGGRKTYDYWSTVHGRNSYDNLGAYKKAMSTLMLTMIMLTGMVV